MRSEVRPVRRLRGADPLDLNACLEPVIEALREASIDLSRVRVVCDWIQYRSSFREVADLRPVLPAVLQADEREPGIELAIDLRRGADVDLRALVTGLLAEYAAQHAPAVVRPQASGRVWLEPWVAGSASCIWRFNTLYWQALSAWEQATGREYEKSLPGGKTDASNVGAVRELILELFKVWDDLDARGALPAELYVVELGVGNGSQARTWLDEFVALSSAHSRDYYRRLHYLMGDYSPHVLSRARQAVARHGDHVNALVVDATHPAISLGFLNGKAFLVYISNVYDNLPSDEVARVGGRAYQVQVRAFLPAAAARRIARRFSAPARTQTSGYMSTTAHSAASRRPCRCCTRSGGSPRRCGNEGGAGMRMPRQAATLLPTTVIGSYAVPEWLGQLRNDYYQRRISRNYLNEIHEMAIKAAILDQERAGIDIFSDGELRRDNDIDYLLARIPGVEIPHMAKADYLDYYDAQVTRPLPEPDGLGLGLADDFRFASHLTDMPVKVSLTGPFSLSRRIRDSAYSDPGDLVRALARHLNAEAAELARAGAALLQIDEPFLAGYPEDIALAVEAINIVTDVPEVSWVLHVCYGNRYARPLWAGHYDFLFPAVQDTKVDRLALEFARKGDEDLRLLEQYHWDRGLGLGVIDVKTDQVESQELVAARIGRALRYVAPEQLMINPDCGLRHLQPDAARAKLATMVAAAAQVRAELSLW